MTVRAAIRLGKLDRLVDRNAIGNVRLVQKLPGANGQYRFFDRRQLAWSAIEIRSKCLHQRIEVVNDSAPKAVEERGVAFGEAAGFGQLRADGGRIGARQQPLVESLQRELAGAVAATLHRSRSIGWPSPTRRAPRRDLSMRLALAPAPPCR